MATGWIVLLAVMLLTGWLLWTPLRLEIDSAAGIVRAEWRGICAVRWLPGEALDHLQLQVFFIRRTIRLGAAPARPKTSPTPAATPKKPSSGKTMPFRRVLRLARRVLRSFEIKRLVIFWDSGDFIWNARVYPLAYFLSSRLNGQVEINFMGRRELSLLVENRLGRMLWAFLQTFTTNRSIS